MAGLLSDARARAVSEGTPYLVYFNAPSVDANGNCGAAAVEVRDADHSYSITPGDDTHEFHLPSGSCQKVQPVNTADSPTPMPMPREDLAVRAPDGSLVGAVVDTAASTLNSTTTAVTGAVTGLNGGSSNSGSGSSSSGSGSSGSGSSGSGSGSSGDGSGSMATTSADGTATLQPRTSTVAETAVNGATFPIDANSGLPVIAFSEHGIPVDPANPNAWGSGAGGVYLTDGTSTFAALVEPLGDVKLRAYDPASQAWQ
jgi:hypothetical protein